jgi:predicted AlkP superfamily phosphohydrolase/phosphomutase
MIYTMEKLGDWDFFMGVVQFPDQIEHTFWHHMDPEHPRHDPAAPARWKNAIRDNYAALDRQLGRVIEKAGPGTTVFVISDHGAGPIDTDIHLNTWLLERGWLHLKADAMTRAKKLLYRLDVTPARAFKLGFALGLGGAARKTFRRKGRGILSMADKVFLSFQDVDWSRTRAYAFGTYACIYVNLKGREPNGIVEPGEDYRRTVDGIAADLMQMRDPRTGRTLVERVCRNEEIYSGPRANEGADLVLFPRDGRYHPFGLFRFASRKWLQPPFDGRSGWHRMNGVLVAAGPGVRSGERLEGAGIIDLMPNILAALDVPVPTRADGRVIEGLWTPEFLAAHPLRSAGDAGEVARAHTAYSDEDEALVSQRLADLGY